MGCCTSNLPREPRKNTSARVHFTHVCTCFHYEYPKAHYVFTLFLQCFCFRCTHHTHGDRYPRTEVHHVQMYIIIVARVKVKPHSENSWCVLTNTYSLYLVVWLTSAFSTLQLQYIVCSSLDNQHLTTRYMYMRDYCQQNNISICSSS